jgi:hypothetical protein
VADPGRLEALAAAGRRHAEATFDARRNGRRLAGILEAATEAHRRRG